MEENQVITLMNIIKLPFVFIFYLLYIILSIFIPARYASRIINIEAVEEKLNLYFNNSFYLRLIALLISIFVYIYIK